MAVGRKAQAHPPGSLRSRVQVRVSELLDETGSGLQVWLTLAARPMVIVPAVLLTVQYSLAEPHRARSTPFLKREIRKKKGEAHL